MIVTWPNTATLSATFLDDTGWVTFTYLWEQVAGPATATIVDPDQLETEVTFLETQGQYVFRFTASGDTYPSDYNDYWLTETNERLFTEDDEPLILDEADTGISSSVLYRIFILAEVAPDASGPTAQGKDLYIKINGVDYVTDAADPDKTIDADSLSIQENKDSTPNTASFVARGFVPNIGDQIVITLDDERIFAGQLLRSAHTADETLDKDYVQISVPDFTWHFNRYRINQKFEGVSASSVAVAIVSLCPGFSAGKIQSGLPPVDIDFQKVTLASAFSALCEKVPGSTWKPDYFKVVYFGTADLSSDQPAPLTTSHPTLQNFSVERDLGQWITQVRVNGASTSSNRDRSEYGKLFVSSIDGFENESGNVNVDGFDTSYSGAGKRIKPSTPSISAPGSPPGIPAPGDPDVPEDDANCDPLEDQLRRGVVRVEGRAIRTGMLSSGLPIGNYHYYTTYVTNEGESGWKDDIMVGLTNLSIPTFLPGGAGGVNWDKKYHYNAVEFVATVFPLGLQRINIYRAAFVEAYNQEHTHIVVGEGGKLVGSLVGKGSFGELGTEGPVIGAEGGGTPANAGRILTPSSNSSIDMVFELPDNEQALPAEPIPTNPVCTDPVTGETTSHTTPSESGDGNDSLPSADMEYFLEGISNFKFLPSGIRVQRFVIVSDIPAIATLGGLLGDSGIIQDEISDTSLKTQQAMIEAGYNRMAERNRVDLAISYASRDQHTHPGKYIAVDLPAPFHCHDEFLIQTVTINGFKLVGDGGELKSWPLYTVSRASPRQTHLTAMLRR